MVAGPTFAEVMSGALQLYNVPPDAPQTLDPNQPKLSLARQEVKVVPHT